MVEVRGKWGEMTAFVALWSRVSGVLGENIKEVAE